MKPVIAFVGYVTSGKDRAAEIAQDRGFALFSGGDLLRSIADELGIPKDRDSLIRYGNLYRRRFGSDIIFRGAVQEIKAAPEGSKHVLHSFRNPAEVELVQKELGALVVEVWAPPEVRFQRMPDRNKEGNPKTWEAFQRLEDIDHGIGQELSGQNIAECVALAEVVIRNEGTLRDLEGKIDELLISRGFIEGNPPRKEVH